MDDVSQRDGAELTEGHSASTARGRRGEGATLWAGQDAEGVRAVGIADVGPGHRCDRLGHYAPTCSDGREAPHSGAPLPSAGEDRQDDLHARTPTKGRCRVTGRARCAPHSSYGYANAPGPGTFPQKAVSTASRPALRMPRVLPQGHQTCPRHARHGPAPPAPVAPRRTGPWSAPSTSAICNAPCPARTPAPVGPDAPAAGGTTASKAAIAPPTETV